ncbi:Ig-like domain repeat protein [Cellulomonas sp. URHE0023]|uniref:Ig-like domain repeat protein n=1 Tax=Cellulomonas sp. URHE0023 TaxID=1380354 RepID=UPI000480A5B5|nr:Ig-like domain repeat protein [Cellulomonas sp. URHE0023]
MLALPSPRARRNRRAPRAVATLAALAVLALGAVAGSTAASADPATGGSFRSAVPLPVPGLNGWLTTSNVGADPNFFGNETSPSFWPYATWFSFTPSSNARLSVSVTGSNYDATLELWTENGRFVTTDDGSDDPLFHPRISADVVGGTSYRLGLGGYVATGTATMRITADYFAGAPSGLTATAGDGSAAVAWSAPVGTALTRYGLTCRTATKPAWTCATVAGNPPATLTTVTGLTNLEPVTITVTATNALGSGPASGPVVVTPGVASSIALRTDPAAPSSGQTYAVLATVTGADPGVPAGAVDLTVDGGAVVTVPLVSGVARLDGLTHAAGSSSLTAAYAGSNPYLPSSAEATTTVGKRTQTLSLVAPAAAAFGDTGLPLAAISTEGLPVTVVASGACTLDGPTLSATGTGTCTVSATQDGTTEVAAASPVTRTFVVARRAHSVTIAPLGALTLGSSAVVTATSSVGLPVTLMAAGACVLDGGRVRAVNSGSCTVTAESAGDAHTLAAHASATVQVPASAVSATVTIGAELGTAAAGAGFTAKGTGLRPGSDAVVVVHSAPVELARAVVLADGTVAVTGALPSGLEATDHALTFTGTALDGSAVSGEETFAVGPSGTLVRIGSRALPAPVPAPTPTSATTQSPSPGTAPASLATTGSGDVRGLTALGALALLVGSAARASVRRRATRS